MSGHRIASAAAVLAASVALVACGDLESEGGGDNERGDLTTGETTTSGEPRPELPARPAGVVGIEGAIDGSLTDAVRLEFGEQASQRGLAITTDAVRTDETAGLQALCSGETDLVDASREITDQELEACGANGLQVVDFRVAFDATVIVTRNERDVGADCVNFDQLRSMYAAGSPITAWNQINPNFFPLRLVPVGPDESSPDFVYFGQRVLGDPAPSLAAFRSDYGAFENEIDIKNAVAEPTPPGAVGIVSFTFYELFEDKLRPLEIDGQTGDRCVFPSDETISSELYPLERTLRIYTTQRSLQRQEVQGFLRFYLQGAERLAQREQLIPIADAVRDQELARLTDPTAYGEVEEGEVAEPSPNGVVEVPTATTPSTTPSPSTSTTPTASVPGDASSTESTTTPTTTTP